ncbi:hypothetical protein Misp02_42200 [Microtetraspora sp. NBRC 16547]|nr:hypothetical protein Misp02_42200 [Microtetraspora sp. NBRC 16547]
MDTGVDSAVDAVTEAEDDGAAASVPEEEHPASKVSTTVPVATGRTIRLKLVTQEEPFSARPVCGGPKDGHVPVRDPFVKDPTAMSAHHFVTQFDHGCQIAS